ncbi:unnamed protein product [Haemonchus placei]|uniref:DNA-directed RNA polymerase II subunit RPB1 n=1 Tax=Haemonchus placei TaxID=6290 RepID=A0A0N4WJF0_HAEPC|nr:unnamed protein product [Haemonchus placei]
MYIFVLHISLSHAASISSCSQALISDDLARCTMSKQFSARDLPNIQNSSHRKTTKRTLGELANTVAYSLPITCSKALDEGLIEPTVIEQCRSQVPIPQTHPTYPYGYTYESGYLDTRTPIQPVHPGTTPVPGKQSVPAQPVPQYGYPQWPGYAITRSNSQPSAPPAYSQWQQYGTYSAGSSYESQQGISPQVYNPSIPMSGYGFYTTVPPQSTTLPTSVIPLAPRAQTPSYKSPNNHGYPADYREQTRRPYTIGKFGTCELLIPCFEQDIFPITWTLYVTAMYVAQLWPTTKVTTLRTNSKLWKMHPLKPDNTRFQSEK